MARVTPASYSVYAPLRYEVTRSFAKKFCQRAKAVEFLRGADRLYLIFTNELHDLIAKKIPIDILNYFICKNESEALRSYYDFFKDGRVIYDFHKNLTTALLATDVEKVSLASIKFPSDAFYLHFGDVKWPEDYPLQIEGVYFNKSDNGFSLLPVANGKFTSPFEVEVNNSKKYQRIPVNINGDYVDIDGFLNSETSRISTLTTNCIEVTGVPEMPDLLGLTSLDPVRHAMTVRVVINCLLYLSAVPSDIDEDWDDRAPRALVLQASDSKKEGARQSAERTLANQDYLKVKLVGRKFLAGTGHHAGQSVKKITHLRRGHFKNQAYGPEWAEHRIIFVPPVLVNSDSGEIPGRIYET
jgi:hypothetical protein